MIFIYIYICIYVCVLSCENFSLISDLYDLVHNVLRAMRMPEGSFSVHFSTPYDALQATCKLHGLQLRSLCGNGGVLEARVWEYMYRA